MSEENPNTIHIYQIWRSDCDCGEVEDFAGGDDPEITECPNCGTKDVTYN